MTNIFKSRTVWTLVAIFAFNGLQAIAPMVSGQVSVVVNFVLSVAGIYFRGNPQVTL